MYNCNNWTNSKWLNGIDQNESNLISGHAILFHLLKFALQLILTFSFLLCTADVNLPSVQFFTIHVIHGLQRRTFIRWNQTVISEWCTILMMKHNSKLTFCASSCLSKLTKPNPFDLPVSSVITRTLSAGPSKTEQLVNMFNRQRHMCNLVVCKGHACEISSHTIFAKQLLQLLIIHVLSKVLDVNVGELSGTRPELRLPFFAWFEAAHKSVAEEIIEDASQISLR